MSVLVLISAFQALPIIYSYFVIKTKRFKFIESNEITNHKLFNEECNKLKDKLESLGFSFLGIKLESNLFPRRRIETYEFISLDKPIFATIGFSNDKPDYYFYTPFNDGGVVLTSKDVFYNVEIGNFSLIKVEKDSLYDVLLIHQNKVQEFKYKGIDTYNSLTKQSRLEATKGFYENNNFLDLYKKAMYKPTVSLIIYSILLITMVLLRLFIF